MKNNIPNGKDMMEFLLNLLCIQQNVKRTYRLEKK